MNQRISVNAGVTRQQQDTRQRLGRCFLGMIVACLLAAMPSLLSCALFVATLRLRGSR